MLDASMILEQDLMEKKYWIWGLDGSGMEVDDEIVCKGSRWLFHLMKQFSRQLTLEVFNCRGAISYFTRVSQPYDMICVNNNFLIPK